MRWIILPCSPWPGFPPSAKVQAYIKMFLLSELASPVGNATGMRVEKDTCWKSWRKRRADWEWYTNSTTKVYKNNQLTWTCLKIPWLNSSKYFTCQTRKDPSVGWIVNSMSGLLFHSMISVSIFRSKSIEGKGMLELDPGEDALVLPCSPGSPSSPCSEEALSDISSRSKIRNKSWFFKVIIQNLNVVSRPYQSQTS